MPQFILNTPPSVHELNMGRLNGSKPRKVHSFYSLDTFARGYVEAMFFTNGDTGDERDNLLNDWGVECLTADAVETVRKDCAQFRAIIMPNGSTAGAWIDVLANSDEPVSYGNGCCDDARAGNFFWYARQGHGVSWTDDYSRDDWRYNLADGLQEACRSFGECYVEAHRKRIHVR